MVALVLVTLALGQGSLFQQVIPSPTGRNGYEELVRAGEFLSEKQFGAYSVVDAQGVVPESRQQEGSKGEPPVETPPRVQAVYDALKGKTLLQRRRWASERFAPAIDLIYKAAEKPIFDPRTNVSVKTTFPELASLKDIAKLISVASYVYLADGKGPQATQLLVTGLDIFERTSYSTLIHYLVGIACQSIILASVEQYLTYFSQADSRKLEEAALKLLDRPTVAGQAVINDGKFSSSLLDDVFDDSPSIEALFQDSDQEKAKSAIRNLSAPAKARVTLAIKQRYHDSVQRVAQRFNGPESGWVEDDDPSLALKPDWSSESGIADAITDALTPVYTQVGISAARSRTQLRLLGLVASVIKYRWEHNQLPVRLEEAVGKDRVRDPLSQLPFELRRDGATGFSIISKGTKRTGEIALRYRRQTDTGNPGPPLGQARD